jgi:hypothetical protein
LSPRKLRRGLPITRAPDTLGAVLNVAAGAKLEYSKPLWSWRRGHAMMGLSLALGLAAACTHSDAARALDPRAVAPAPATQWCLGQRDGNSDRPACYEHLITCVMAALTHAGWCTQRPQTPASLDAMNRRAAVVPVSRHRTHASVGQHKFSAAERDELYREFQKWRGGSTSE